MPAALIRIFLAAWVLLAAVQCAPARAAVAVAAGFEDQQISAGLHEPSALVALPDGRVLVLQQDGRLLRAREGRAPQDFYTVPAVVADAARGCLGLAVDPAFTRNHYLYLYCTVQENGGPPHDRVLRVIAGQQLVIPGSQRSLLALPPLPPGAQQYRGGALGFGADGNLYVGVGDLQGAASSAQNVATPFGKLLRIGRDGAPPLDNPFYFRAGADRRIFALGFSSPSALDIFEDSGQLLVNDGAPGQVQQINRVVAGANFGRPVIEGGTTDLRFANPLFQYSPRADACDLRGAVFYQPPNQQFPAVYAGKYFFADRCKGSLYVLDPAAPDSVTEFAAAIDAPFALAVSSDGSLYYLTRPAGPGSARLGRIRNTSALAPTL